MAVLHQDGQVLGQLRTGRHREPEGRGPTDGGRPDGAGHHAGRPSEEDHEQHTGHASAVFGQPVRGLSRLDETQNVSMRSERFSRDLWFLHNINIYIYEYVCVCVCVYIFM